MEAFKIKNGLSAKRYLGSNGTETAGSVGYNLAGASYDSKSYDTQAQTTVIYSVDFKPDGTKMYALDLVGDVIYQYSLSTPWDVSTASYDSKSLSAASQDTTTRAARLSSDGTKVYVMGDTNNTIYQYTLSTAWDLSTGSYASKSFSVASQSTTPMDIAFKPDGTAFYLASQVGSVADAVVQYTLSTAWDVSTASYSSKSLSINSQETSITCCDISEDGYTVIASGNVTDTVFKYTLSTAWDLNTGSYSGESFSLTGQMSDVNDIKFGNSGNKLYAVKGSPDTIYQYSPVAYTQTLDLSTGTTFSFTPSGATTVSFTNPPASGNAIGFSVEINGDGSAITWPSSVKWHKATAPTATATKELYTFVTTDGGTTYYGKKAAEGVA
jgi:6-phosphogluconolactonase (cycloisomerase 2 family)